MTEFFLAVAFILIIILWVRTNTLSRRIGNLVDKIRQLETEGFHLKAKTPAGQKEPSKEAAHETAMNQPVLQSPVKEKRAAFAAETTEVRTISKTPDRKIDRASEEKKVSGVETPIRKPAAKKEKPAFLVALEKQLVENWTGILGAAILVMGIGFLGIYAALSFSALFRSLMVFCVAAILFAVWFILRNMKKWIKFSRWMRSASGAVLIFACLGAGGIPGLKCIDNIWIAFPLLVFGILINLYFGYAGGTQYFASLHVLISLAALAAAPQTHVTFIVAGIIVFTSIVIAFRDRWEYHLLICICSFFAYHLYWYIGGGFAEQPIPVYMRNTGIATTLLVGITAIASHYRQIYRSIKFETLPFLVHLLNWAFLGAGLLFYSTGSKWNCVILASAVVLVFFLARHARTLGIRWLYVTDVLIAQSLALFALFLLTRWGLDAYSIAGLVYLEVLLFLIIMVREGDWIPQKIGILLHHLSMITLAVLAVYYYTQDPGKIFRHAVVTGSVLLIQTVFHLWNRARQGESFDSLSAYGKKVPDGILSIGGIMIPLIALFFFYITGSQSWGIGVFGVIAVLLLVIRQRSQANGIGVGLCVMIPVALMKSWEALFAPDLSVTRILIASIPMFVTAIVCTKASRVDVLKKWIKWPGIYLFTIHLIVVGYLATKSAPAIVPGIIALIISIIYLEAAQFIRARKGETLTTEGNSDRYILHAAYIFVAIFLIRHVAVDLQYESYFHFVHVRLIVEIFALAAFLYWALAKRRASSPSFKSWTHLQPLFWELLIGFSVVPVILEVPDMLLPIVWALYAHMLLFSGRFVSRMRLYSAFFFWAAIFNVSFILSVNALPSLDAAGKIVRVGFVSLVLICLYAVRYFRESRLEAIDCPPLVAFMKHIASGLVKTRNIFIYYFLAGAIMFAVYRFTAPVSPFISGCVWLVVSIVYPEISRYLTRKYGSRCADEGFIDSCMLNSGIAFVVAFLIRHMTVHLQSEAHVGGVPVRLVIEIFALAVFVYWAATKTPEHGKGYAVWKYILPLFWDLIVVFAMMTVMIETPFRIHPLIWIVAAIMLLLAGARITSVSRFRFYSLVFHWITIFTVVFLLTSYRMPTDEWYNEARSVGALTILIQFVYVTLFHRRGYLDKVTFPLPLQFLSGLVSALARRQNLAVYYPLFVGMAVFIYTAFDPSIHTLLWVVEAFAIFVVSVILRENHFRFLSMGVLGACLVRLLVHDLSSSGTVVKGIVFVCVGLLMLAMNMIYNKYRSRF